MISIKKDQGAKDRFIWEWLLHVIELLGEGGMSSDESEVDAAGQAVYRVNTMPWRRDMSKEMDILDSQRKEAHLFSKKGSKPLGRTRKGDVGESRRPEIQALPKILYNQEWLKGLPRIIKDDFEISKEKLNWMKIWIDNDE